MVAVFVVRWASDFRVNPLDYRGKSKALGIVPQVLRDDRQHMKALLQLKTQRGITQFFLNDFKQYSAAFI